MKHSSRSVVSHGSGYSHGARSCVILDDSNSSFLCKDDDVFAIPARSRVAETARSKGSFTREQSGDRSANGAWNHSRLSRIHVSPIPEENRSQEQDDNRNKEKIARLIADAGDRSYKAAPKVTNLSRAKLPADDYEDSKELYFSPAEREEQAELARRSLDKSAMKLLPSGNKSRPSSMISEKAIPIAKSFSEATPKSPRSSASGRVRSVAPANSSHAESFVENLHSEITDSAVTQNHHHHRRESNISTDLGEPKKISRDSSKNRLSSHDNNSVEVSRQDYQKSPYNSRKTDKVSQSNSRSAYNRSISKFMNFNANNKSSDLYGDNEPSEFSISRKPARLHGSNNLAEIHSSNRSAEFNGSQRSAEIDSRNRSAEFNGIQRSSDFHSSRKSAQVRSSNTSLQQIGSGSSHETSQHGAFLEAHSDRRVLPEESPVLEESRLSQDEHQQAILLNQSVHVRPGFDYNGEILRLQKKMGKLQAKIAHMQKKVLHLQGQSQIVKQD